MRTSPVAPAQRSERALRKAAKKRVENGVPVHSFRTLLCDLSTVAKNRVQPKAQGALAFDLVTTPTPLQQQAFDLLGVSCRMYTVRRRTITEVPYAYRALPLPKAGNFALAITATPEPPVKIRARLAVHHLLVEAS